MRSWLMKSLYLLVRVATEFKSAVAISFRLESINLYESTPHEGSPPETEKSPTITELSMIL